MLQNDGFTVRLLPDSPLQFFLPAGFSCSSTSCRWMALTSWVFITSSILKAHMVSSAYSPNPQQQLMSPDGSNHCQYKLGTKQLGYYLLVSAGPFVEGVKSSESNLEKEFSRMQKVIIQWISQLWHPVRQLPATCHSQWPRPLNYAELQT